MKRKPKSSGGGANWMDTYGDMVTLLLCFFVLLYSMSSVDEDKWKALVMSFNPNAQIAETVTSGGDGPSADGDGAGVMPQGDGVTQKDVDDQMSMLYKALSDFVSEEGAQSNISVTQGDGRIFISFNQAVFFNGDSPVLREDAYPILDRVCEMLSGAADAIDEVRVLGHTAQGSPDEPNNVEVDRSLSSNRATNVVIYVQKHSTVEPARLISEGVGQWRPIASNDTPEGRAKNRRVEMIISGRNLEQELKGDIQSYEVAAS